VGIPAYTVKVNAKFPAARPALRGVICLHSLEDGELLALLDSAAVTSWRTGLAAAAVADALAPPGCASVGLIGAGAQAEIFLRGFAALRTLRAVTVVDVDPAAGRRLTALAAALPGEPRVLVGRTAADTGRCDVLVTATWSRRPVLRASDLAGSCRVVVALGFDEPGKREVDDDVLETSRLVIDDPVQAGQIGVLAGSPRLRWQEVADALGPSTGGAATRTVYAPVGMPWQDLALAWPVYRAAAAASEPLPEIDLLS
jgi:ornithine cyclodeaminase